MREGKGFGSITPKVSTYLRKKTYHILAAVVSILNSIYETFSIFTLYFVVDKIFILIFSKF